MLNNIKQIMLQQTRINLVMHSLQVRPKDAKHEETSRKQNSKSRLYLPNQNFFTKKLFSRDLFMTLSDIFDGSIYLLSISPKMLRHKYLQKQ